MTILLTGLNHKTAPVEVRERLAFKTEECRAALRTLVDSELVREALIVSTCNRVEVLTFVDEARSEQSARAVENFLAAERGLSLDSFKQHLYTCTDEDAVRHLFRVASSLDSMVLGEPQILGQVRRAYTLAVEAGTAGHLMHRLLHQAFHTAKRVRNETAVASSAVSVSYTAVELARKIFDTLEEKTVLLVGAGEMAELAAQHLKKAGASNILVANRTKETGERLAQKFGGRAVDYSLLSSHLREADVVICSTCAPGYVITEEMAREVLAERRKRPSVYIDISVPRNIDPRVSQVNNLFVFDVDDMESVIVSNIRERKREAERAERIVEAEVMKFQRSLLEIEIGPKIGQLRQNLQGIALAELQRQRARLGDLTPEQERALEALLLSTVNKISHPILQQMRRSYSEGEVERAAVWERIFAPAI